MRRSSKKFHTGSCVLVLFINSFHLALSPLSLLLLSLLTSMSLQHWLIV